MTRKNFAFMIAAMLLSSCTLDSKETYKARTLENIKSGRTLDIISGLTPNTYETIIGLDFGRYYEIVYHEGQTSFKELAAAPQNICGEYLRKPKEIKYGTVTQRAIDLFSLTENYAHISDLTKVPPHWRSMTFNCK